MEMTKDALKALTNDFDKPENMNRFIRLSFEPGTYNIIYTVSFDSEYSIIDRITELCGMRIVFDSRFEGVCPYLVIDHDPEKGYIVKELAHNKNGKCPCCQY